MLTFDGLLAVVVLAEELNFTQAAARLFLSPSGLSRRVLAVERSLDLSLFQRTSRVVELTPAGRAFLPYAEAALDALQQGANAAAQACGRSTTQR